MNYNCNKIPYTTYDSSFSENSGKVWYTHYRGCIIKNLINPTNNKIEQQRIYQGKIAYNQPITSIINR